MYTDINFSSKKAIKEMIAKAGNAGGVFQPNNMFGDAANPPRDGVVTIEGPHYPRPHTWYGRATLKDGVIVAVK